MSAVVVSLLALAALAYVVVPALKHSDDPAPAPEAADAEQKKLRALGAILDLESEYESGRITSDELEVLRVEHERDAIDAMRELDVLEMTLSDDDLEAAIAAERDRLKCPSCGAPRGDQERCSACGA
jgi:hypothetical protein